MVRFYVNRKSGTSGYISMGDARRVRSLDVKSTEVNTEKGLKTRHFRELGVLFRLSDFFVLGCLQPGIIEGRVDRMKMGKVELTR